MEKATSHRQPYPFTLFASRATGTPICFCFITVFGRVLFLLDNGTAGSLSDPQESHANPPEFVARHERDSKDLAQPSSADFGRFIALARDFHLETTSLPVHCRSLRKRSRERPHQHLVRRASNSSGIYKNKTQTFSLAFVCISVDYQFWEDSPEAQTDKFVFGIAESHLHHYQCSHRGVFPKDTTTN